MALAGALTCGFSGLRIKQGLTNFRLPTQQRAAAHPSRPSKHCGRQFFAIGHLSRRTYLWRMLAIALFASLFCLDASLAASVGVVSKVENQAQVGTATAVVGMPVQMGDAVRTGPKSHLELTFNDDTKLTLGENAKVVIDRYVYNPENSAGELALTTTAAAFRLVTGKLSKMHDRSIKVSTPNAALAVRGTDFWWGTVDGQFGALLVSNSRLDVSDEKCDETEKDNDGRRRCRCRVTLDEAGEGTDIRRGCPGAPYMWPPGKVAAALSTTTFGLALGPGGLVPAAAAAGALGAYLGSTSGGGDNKKPTVSDMISNPPTDNGGGGGGGGPSP